MLEEDRRLSDYEPIKQYQFWVKWGDGQPPVRLSVRGDLADTRNAVSDDELRQHLVRGVAAGLYRPPYVAPLMPEEPVEVEPVERVGDVAPVAPEPMPVRQRRKPAKSVELKADEVLDDDEGSSRHYLPQKLPNLPSGRRRLPSPLRREPENQLGASPSCSLTRGRIRNDAPTGPQRRSAGGAGGLGRLPPDDG